MASYGMMRLDRTKMKENGEGLDFSLLNLTCAERKDLQKCHGLLHLLIAFDILSHTY